MTMFANQAPTTSPLYRAIEQVFNEQTSYGLNNGRLTWEQINQMKAWFPEAANNIYQSLVNQYGNQVSSQAIQQNVIAFINDACQRMQGFQQQPMNTGMTYQQNVVIPQQGYTHGYQPLPGRGTPTGQPVDYTQSNAGIYGNNAQNTAPAATSEPVQPKTTFLSKEPEPMAEAPIEAAPFQAPDKANCGAAVTDPHTIGENQICTNAVTYSDKSAGAGIKYHFKAFEINVPEMSDGHLIRSFKHINSGLISHAPWLYDITYPKYVVLDAEYSAVKELISSIQTKIGAGQDDYTGGVLKELKRKSYEIYTMMDSILSAEINKLLRRYLVSSASKHDLEIEVLDDIEDLFNLQNVEAYKSLVTLENYNPVAISILAKVFDKYFGNGTKVLSIPDDIANIVACPEVIIRHARFTERDAASGMDAERTELLHEALKEKTVITVPHRIVYTNIFPAQMAARLNSANAKTIHKVAQDQCILDAMLRECLSTSSVPFDTYYYDAEASTTKILNVGRSLEGHLTVSMT